MRNCNLIQVGDFGLGINKDDEKTAEYYNKRWAFSKVNVYAIRGNHDNPAWFDGTKNWSNIHLVADYTVLELEGKKILFIGGAVSLDRQLLIEGRSWWPNEGFNYDEDKLNEILKKEERIDIVVTHTAPEFCLPLGNGGLADHYALNDKWLKLDINAERAELARAYQVIKPYKPSMWFYGHFHRSQYEVIDGTAFRCLGVGEIINV